MSLNRNEKAAVVSDVSAQAARAQTLAMAEYRGLTVENLNKLRVDARSKGVYLHVLKNSLARRAVVGTPFEVAQGAMVGPLIYGFSEDAVAAAKVVADFAKTNDKLVIMGGAYAGKVLSAEGVKALASIPSREVLISQIAGLLKSPIQRFAAVLAAVVEKQGGTPAEAEAEAAPAADAQAAPTAEVEAPAPGVAEAAPAAVEAAPAAAEAASAVEATPATTETEVEAGTKPDTPAAA